MNSAGLIHDKLDIKILILYVLRRLTEPVSMTLLADLCLFDRGIMWFDFADCISELEETGHVTESPEGYSITEKGDRNGSAIESSIPYTVRCEADRLLRPVVVAQRRNSMISATHSVQPDGGCMVELSLSDGVGEIFSLNLLASGEEQAEKMEKTFRADAEGFYNKLVTMLAPEEQRVKSDK